jgi:mono/diheme cytochrome c family protein
MNLLHQWLCRSARWQKKVDERVPWVLNGKNLGTALLELGPGPGLTTEVLRRHVPFVTALEIEVRSATSLASRFQGMNVEVVAGDATEMPFQDAHFSSAVSFTMLHHVTSPALQDELFREVHRVLKPGGYFLGCDSLRSWLMSLIHIGDTLVPVEPKTVATRLEEAGFESVEVEVGAAAFRFSARKPRNQEEPENKGLVQADRSSQRLRVLPLFFPMLLIALLAGFGSVQDGWLRRVPTDEHHRKSPILDHSRSVSAGSQLFHDHCAICHGPMAEGTHRAPGLSTGRVRRQATDGDLHWLLVNGNRDRGMPAWGTKLQDRQLWELISYLRSLPPRDSSANQ